MKIAVAMSGGVDSSTAASLLLEQGHEVIGVYMRLVSGDAGESLVAPDPSKARLAAEHLGVPLHVVEFSRELEALVTYFCSEYDAGRTPNPCCLCNKWNKFGRLLRYAQGLGAECLATGHYVRVEQEDGRWLLRRGLDPTKDQSYMLFGLAQHQLEHARFPLGGFRKQEVRQMAKGRGLPMHESKESQDVCFVARNDHLSLLRERLGDRLQPGDILDTEGRVVGQHGGCQCFTIGQRRRLGVALGSRRYVVKVDRPANTITIGLKEDLLRAAMRVSQLNWIAFEEPREPFEAAVQIRYSHRPAACRVEPMADGSVTVAFGEAQTGVTPGQAAVFYRDDVVLGGGWIEAAG
jgi:tRNA-specific 2-thiouridylase